MVSFSLINFSFFFFKFIIFVLSLELEPRDLQWEESRYFSSVLCVLLSNFFHKLRLLQDKNSDKDVENIVKRQDQPPTVKIGLKLNAMRNPVIIGCLMYL